MTALRARTMRKESVMRAMMLTGYSALALLLGGRRQATSAWGPGTPRNRAGQPIDAIYGTPLPGYPALNK